jgi:hypothetical protein
MAAIGKGQKPNPLRSGEVLGALPNCGDATMKSATNLRLMALCYNLE